MSVPPLPAPDKPPVSVDAPGHTSQESTIELSQEPICDLLKSCHSQAQGLSSYTKSLQALRENLLKSLLPRHPGLLVELDSVANSSAGQVSSPSAVESNESTERGAIGSRIIINKNFSQKTHDSEPDGASLGEHYDEK